MTLQKKVVLIFLMLGIVFAIGSFAGLASVVYPTFESFERESAEQDLQRAEEAINAELSNLRVFAREYSEWDHTYEYVQGLRSDYEEENMDTSYWKSIGINMMLFFDADGQMLWGAMIDPSLTKEVPLDAELLQPIAGDHPLLNRPNELEDVFGLIQARSAPFLVTSNPILTSVGEGPAVGTLIVGKFLDADHVSSLANRTSVDLALRDRTSPADAELFGVIEARSSNGDNSLVWAYDDEYVVARRIRNDVFGKPSFLIEVKTSKRITEIGWNTINTAFVFLLAVSAFFLFSALLLMRFLIVAPVSKLTQHMLKIRNSGNLDRPFGSDRQDEIGQLANEFDQLAANLGNAQTELEKARDEALALSKAKGEFLARMSHEIRTPMNGVLGMMELLNNTPLVDTQKRYAQTIHESADTLLEIINDVLDFSKIESGKMQLESIFFDLNSFLSDLVASLSGLAHGKGLAIELTLPDGPGLAVYGDPFRLRQVMTNLIGNAIKFTDEGTVSLCVTTVDVDATYKEIHFAVKDTGIGISNDKQELIFDSFSQEDGTTTRRFGGTGLGLAISKQLVGMMNGELQVESEVGKGSSFSFSLRMKASNKSDFSESARILQEGLFAAKTKRAEIGLLTGRVLLAEDNAVNQEVAIGMMAAMGVEVVVAKNGEEAVNLFKSQHFDAVLMDCQMPVLDGFDATRAIRKIEAETVHVPILIVAVTAGATDGDRQECISAGMNDFLAKPFTGEQLYKILREVMASGDPKSDPDREYCPGPVGAASNSPYSESSVDQDVLDKLAQLPSSGSGKLVHRVVQAYFESSDKLMTQLRGEIDSANADGIRAGAHALKSSSANVGALNFAGLCGVLESAGKQEDLIQVEATWQQMQEEYSSVIEALKCRLKVAAA